MEVGVGVDGGVGEDEQDGSREDEWSLKEWSGGGNAMGGQCL